MYSCGISRHDLDVCISWHLEEMASICRGIQRRSMASCDTFIIPILTSKWRSFILTWSIVNNSLHIIVWTIKVLRVTRATASEVLSLLSSLVYQIPKNHSPAIPSLISPFAKIIYLKFYPAQTDHDAILLARYCRKLPRIRLSEQYRYVFKQIKKEADTKPHLKPNEFY